MRPSPLACLPLLLLLAALPAHAEDGHGVPLGPGLWRLSGFDPALPQEDLGPLRPLIGGAQFVGLGESIHTSGGFYKMKDRIFRFLVERMGFRAIGMETAWIRAARTEQFVQTCQGPAADALRGVIPVWQSTEVLEMLQWMCEWNQTHPNDRVHFYGFDIQNQAAPDGEALIAFLERLGVADADPRVAGIRACDGVVTDYFLEGLPFPPELYQQCQSALTDTAAYFDSAQKAIEKQTSREDLAWARVHLVGEQAWQEEIFYLDSDTTRAVGARDRGMAYVAQAIRDLRFPHDRTALWAHSGHIAKDGQSAYFQDTMGGFLDADLGNRYKAFALTAYDTSLNWSITRRCGLFHLLGPNAVEQVFHDLGQGALLADPGGHSPLQPGVSYALGGNPMVPAEHFDAILYLEASPAMHPLGWAPCP